MTNQTPALPAEIRQPAAKPALALWLWERNLSLRAFAPSIGKSHEYVRLICLPFGDPDRREPDDDTAAEIAKATGGDIQADSFKSPLDEVAS